MDNQADTSSIKNIKAMDQSHNLDQWQVLSPVAILYFGVSVFKHLFSNIIYLIPAIVVSYNSVLERPFIWLPAILLAFVLLILFAFVSFKVYRYRLTDDNIEIRSGIFSKKHLNLPFSRVQNVKIEQPIYYRFSGHACLQLDTAGSAKNEAKLVAIKLDFAQQLKTRIQSQSQHNKVDINQENTSAEPSELQSESANSQSQQEIVLNRRHLSDLVIHGITSNRIWIFLGGLAPFYNKIVDSVGEWLTDLGINLTELFSLQTHSLLEVALYALSLTMLIMLLLVSFSVIGAIISFYGYTLSKQDDKYIRRSGLFTKHEVSMSLSRLQMVVQKQDWLDVLLKRINLNFEQSNSFSKNLNSSASSSKIIVPSIKPHECQTLIDDAYPGNALNTLVSKNAFTAISKRFIFRNIVYILMPLWLIVTSVTVINDKLMLAVLASTVFLGLCGLVVLRWKRWGIARDKGFVYLRKGLIGVDYYCFPTYKLQQIQFQQNLLMKRRQLASVKFILASGSLKVPMISEELAYGLIDQGLYQVESSQKSWM
ncbi:PH domain-containing protein [uncultured Paraglaciecola sp.]|uniref:PH domain-containing protein n=1 Tax=uncultured Paraglaciecola sp. TaxID=1765024 RepID=UPI0030DBFF8C|tara:strand:+ start:79028 stop:80644 length:1617 start_codon:yes stop_codon:yes gene_type:complete